MASVDDLCAELLDVAESLAGSERGTGEVVRDDACRDQGLARGHRRWRRDAGVAAPDRKTDGHEPEAAEEVEADRAAEQARGYELLEDRLPDGDAESDA